MRSFLFAFHAPLSTAISTPPSVQSVGTAAQGTALWMMIDSTGAVISSTTGSPGASRGSGPLGKISAASINNREVQLLHIF